MATDRRPPSKTSTRSAAESKPRWYHPVKQSPGQWFNLIITLLFYLVLTVAVWYEIPAWMELLGMKSQSAGGAAAMVFLFFGLPLFFAACLLFLLTELLPKPAILPWVQNCRKPALLLVLAWQVAYFLLANR